MLTLAVATAAGAGATLEQENKMLKEQVARQADALKMQAEAHAEALKQAEAHAEALKICEANASPAAQPAKKKTLFGIGSARGVDCSQCYPPPPLLLVLLSTSDKEACDARVEDCRWLDMQCVGGI